MDDKTKKVLLIVIGIIFLAYGLFAMGYAIYRGKPDWIFWACYVVMVIIGIGAFMRRGYLIAVGLNVVATYLIVWDIDFLYQLIFNKPLWGITNYFFKELLTPARIISFEHLFLVPLGLFAIYLAGLKRKDHWKISIIAAVAVIGATLLLTNPIYNVNCAFESCLPIFSNVPYYPLIWMIFIIATIFVNAFIINKLFYKDVNKIEEKVKKIKG